MVKGAFRENASETDPEKIEQHKEAYVPCLCVSWQAFVANV